MAKFIEPKPGERRKAYLFRAYGIGKGEGRGRISAEGHAHIAVAKEKGFTFSDEDVVVVPKADKKPRVSAEPPRVVLDDASRAAVANVDPGDIRKWAGENGIEVSARGRIAAEVTLRYLSEVPEHERNARANNGKDLRAAAPRVHPVGTKWRADFKNHKGEAETVTLSDKTACGNCHVSLGWCACERPHVTVGYERGPIRLTLIPATTGV